uniref:(California timema) hypothetical protein n=1 Tax=Timema californicum TaxID=61474 RepID=A0A7R9P4W9_TIMCA|nr:unnamed protein product [Timema californicum]
MMDGTLLYERVPNKPEAEKAALNNISPTLLKRRAYEEVNGMDGLPVLNNVKSNQLSQFTDFLV